MEGIGEEGLGHVTSESCSQYFTLCSERSPSLVLTPGTPETQTMGKEQNPETSELTSFLLPQNSPITGHLDIASEAGSLGQK